MVFLFRDNRGTGWMGGQKDGRTDGQSATPIMRPLERGNTSYHVPI